MASPKVDSRDGRDVRKAQTLVFPGRRINNQRGAVGDPEALAKRLLTAVRGVTATSTPDVQTPLESGNFSQALTNLDQHGCEKESGYMRSLIGLDVKEAVLEVLRAFASKGATLVEVDFTVLNEGFTETFDMSIIGGNINAMISNVVAKKEELRAARPEGFDTAVAGAGKRAYEKLKAKLEPKDGDDKITVANKKATTAFYKHMFDDAADSQQAKAEAHKALLDAINYAVARALAYVSAEGISEVTVDANFLVKIKVTFNVAGIIGALGTEAAQVPQPVPGAPPAQNAPPASNTPPASGTPPAQDTPPASNTPPASTTPPPPAS